MDKTKTFYFGVSCEMFGKHYCEVPAHLTEDEAIKYVKENWADISENWEFPIGSYIPDSDAPCFDVYCEFED